MKKYYICSDVHNHFTLLKKTLDEYGFNYNNDTDILVIAGDITDRFSEAKELLLFLKELTDRKKAIILKGNHDEFILSFLRGDCLFFNYSKNGLHATIKSLLDDNDWYSHMNFKYSSETLDKMSQGEYLDEWKEFMKLGSQLINKNYPWLFDWISSFPDYLELDSIIVTHGMLDFTGKDWRKPYIGWNKCHWAKSEDAAFLVNKTNKQLFLGHINTNLIRKLHNEPLDENEDIYIKNNITYLDTCSIVTNRLNMVVVNQNK